MPRHCCVPHCTKKGCKDESGKKISYFQFSNDKTLKRKWLHAIRREEGKYFKILNTTTVCSRHFREGDYRKGDYSIGFEARRERENLRQSGYFYLINKDRQIQAILMVTIKTLPSSLHLNGELFNSYKHHTTLKGMI